MNSTGNTTADEGQITVAAESGGTTTTAPSHSHHQVLPINPVTSPVSAPTGSAHQPVSSHTAAATATATPAATPMTPFATAASTTTTSTFGLYTTTTTTTLRKCITRADARAVSYTYAVSLPGTECVFGVDERDEGFHCIPDAGKYGSYGWCFTTLDQSSWGSCSDSCPLFGMEKVLWDRLKTLHKHMEPTEQNAELGDEEQTWEIAVHPQCTGIVISALCQKFGKNHQCEGRGYSQEAGTDYVLLNGTNGSLQGLWDDPCVRSHHIQGMAAEPQIPQDIQGWEQVWIILTRPECTVSVISALCEKYGKSGQCDSRGHLDEGGRPYMVLRGQDFALQALWGDPCVLSHESARHLVSPPLQAGPGGDLATPPLQQDQGGVVSGQREAGLQGGIAEHIWVITLRPQCTERVGNALCEKYGKNGQCEPAGHPYELDALHKAVRGSDSALQELWRHPCVLSHSAAPEQQGHFMTGEQGPAWRRRYLTTDSDRDLVRDG